MDNDCPHNVLHEFVQDILNNLGSFRLNISFYFLLLMLQTDKIEAFVIKY